jgi:hypothetical protein
MAAFSREKEQAKEILKRLVSLTSQFKQDDLSKQFMQRLSAIVPPEELMPQEPQGIPQEAQ